MQTINDRDALLNQPDAQLLKHCRTERFRGSGRGGQKRNVTDSAVRLTHLASGVAVDCDATRSQARNRELALRRLRLRLALHCRASNPARPDSSPPPSKKSAEYFVWVARIVDLLQSVNWSVGEAATKMGISTNRLVCHMAADRELWQVANRQRQEAGMHPLKAPR